MYAKDKRSFLIGLDLGKNQDHSALAVVERILEETGKRNTNGNLLYAAQYEALDLVRFPLGTPFATPSGENVEDYLKGKCEEVQEIIAKESGMTLGQWRELPRDQRANVWLIIDQGGVGDSEIEHIREKLKDTAIAIMGVKLTGGFDERFAGSYYCVPKVNLVGHVHTVVVGDERIKIPNTLAHGELLRRELRAFQVKQTKTGNEIYEANEGEHDDLVIAVALPLWWGEKYEAKAPPQPQVHLPNFYDSEAFTMH